MLKKLWLKYQLYAARKNAVVEEMNAKIANQNARYFHMRAIMIEQELK